MQKSSTLEASSQDLALGKVGITAEQAETCQPEYHGGFVSPDRYDREQREQQEALQRGIETAVLGTLLRLACHPDIRMTDTIRDDMLVIWREVRDGKHTPGGLPLRITLCHADGTPLPTTATEPPRMKVWAKPSSTIWLLVDDEGRRAPDHGAAWLTLELLTEALSLDPRWRHFDYQGVWAEPAPVTPRLREAGERVVQDYYDQRSWDLNYAMGLLRAALDATKQEADHA